MTRQSRGRPGSQETDVNSAGKTVGFDIVYFTIKGNNSATVNTAIDIKSGLLYGTLTTTSMGKTFKAKISGGDRDIQGDSRHDHPRQDPARSKDGDHDYLQLRHGSLTGDGTACAARPSRLAADREAWPPALAGVASHPRSRRTGGAVAASGGRPPVTAAGSGAGSHTRRFAPSQVLHDAIDGS